MFWDKVSPVYDFFETVYNSKVYHNTGKIVAEEINSGDVVLDCACGTGAISKYIAPKCRLLIASDLAVGMLRQARKKCSKYGNVVFKKADIMDLKCSDERFDKVVAGNVIHLLDEPELALKELLRVCKSGGKVIIPTYINSDNNSLSTAQSVLEKVGFEFKSEFDIESYKAFFSGAGLTDVEYRVVEGNCPCAVAIITKE